MLALVALSGIPAGGGRRPIVPRGPTLPSDERNEESPRVIVSGRKALDSEKNDIIELSVNCVNRRLDVIHVTSWQP